jgi:hypothetical protein
LNKYYQTFKGGDFLDEKKVHIKNFFAEDGKTFQELLMELLKSLFQNKPDRS